jgi:hypothetical protein
VPVLETSPENRRAMSLRGDRKVDVEILHRKEPTVPKKNQPTLSLRGDRKVDVEILHQMKPTVPKKNRPASVVAGSPDPATRTDPERVSNAAA